MALQLSDLGGHIGIIAEGIDLNLPLDAATRNALRRALLEKLVLCIRGQRLTPEAYLAAMHGFGTPLVKKEATQLQGFPEINVLSPQERDVLGDGKRLVNGAWWHTDDSFRAVPCSLTMLYGVEVPSSGGDTQFTNMYRAYETLPEETKRRIADLKVVHMYQPSRQRNPVATMSAEHMAAMPPVEHPLVRTHPETGRKALYMNPNRMEQVVGLSRAESDELLDALIEHAIRPELQYRHKWQQGDILVWDNRCLMHKANPDYPAGEQRTMHRIVVEGSAFLEDVGRRAPDDEPAGRPVDRVLDEVTVEEAAADGAGDDVLVPRDGDSAHVDVGGADRHRGGAVSRARRRRRVEPHPLGLYHFVAVGLGGVVAPGFVFRGAD
jgi:taurine dioxygenase